MVPAEINVGDLVIVKEIDFDNLEKGDIISFYVDANEDGEMDVVTHFFDNVETVDGIKLYRTKSAVSNQLDGWYIDEVDIIGEYVTHIPKIGKLVLYLRSPIGLITLAIDYIVIYLLFSIVDDTKKKAKNNQVEDRDQPNDRNSIEENGL
jgi:signal peptidase